MKKHIIKLVLFAFIILVFSGCSETIKQPFIEKTEVIVTEKSYHQDTTYFWGVNTIKTTDSIGDIIKIEKISKDGYRGDSTKTIEMYNNGILESKVTYKNGILDGSLNFYYEDGTICREANYIDGKLNGTSIDFNEDGTPYRVANFRDGKLFGKYTVYKEKFEKEWETYIYGGVKLSQPIEKLLIPAIPNFLDTDSIPNVTIPQDSLQYE